MRKHTITRRIMTIMLAATLMVSDALPAMAAAPDRTESTYEDIARSSVTPLGTVADPDDDPDDGYQDPEVDDPSTGDPSASDPSTDSPTSGNTGNDSVTDPIDPEAGDEDDDDDEVVDPEAIDDEDTDPEVDEDADGVEVDSDELDIRSVSVDFSDHWSVSGGPDSDEMLEDYLNHMIEEQLPQTGRHSRLSASVPRKTLLTNPVDIVFYEQIAEHTQLIVSGKSSTGVFLIPFSAFNGGQTMFSAEELGVSSVVSGNSISQEAVNALKTKYSMSTDKIMNYLLADYPYDLFWYDKTKGTTWGYSNLYITYSDGRIGFEDPDTYGYTVQMSVSPDYSPTGAEGGYDVSTNKINAVKNTVSNAQAVVTAATSASSSDYEILSYYNTWICDNVDYNHPAADDSYTGGYGNPWQLVWAFDDDPSTKIVCEGYSKAFKLLCDLTTFVSDDITCYTVTGQMAGGTGAGGHMWNVVHMEDGKNYMVDVTNYDSGHTNLFLGGYSEYHSSNGQYDYGTGLNVLCYLYDSGTRSLYTADELALSSTAYDPSSAPSLTKYTVTFDANGHGTDPASVQVPKGGKVTKPSDPTETGWTFVAWYKEPECQNTWDFHKDTISQDTTLYAGWIVREYWIIFDLQGGSATGTSYPNPYPNGYIPNMTVEHGSKISKPSALYSKAGYYVDTSKTHWYTEPDCINAWDFDTPIYSRMTLYLKWTPNNNAVTFETYGGTSIPDQGTLTGSKVIKPDDPEKTGYTFGGWYKDAAYTTLWDFDTEITEPVTIYARWIPKKYDVIFKWGAEWEMANISVVSYDFGSKITPIEAPEKPGHTFVGWYKNTALTQAWDFDTDTVPVGGVSLYPKCTPNSYTVTYNYNNGSSPTSVDAAYGTKLTAPSPVRSGYVLSGWYTTSTFETGTKWAFETDTVPAHALSLYAYWTPDSYTVSFNSCGGTDVSSQTAEYGALITEPSAPIKAGYAFDAWYTTSTYDDGTEWDFDSDTMPIDGLTLYAHYTANDYMVAFTDDNGTVISTTDHPYGSHIESIAGPYKKGHTFRAWCKDIGRTQDWNFATDTVPVGGVTLYPSYTVCSYTVAFVTGTDDAIAHQSVEFGATVTEPAAVLTRSGYDFKGWYRDSACSVKWNFTTDKMGDSDLTLYAGWDKTLDIENPDSAAYKTLEAIYRKKNGLSPEATVTSDQIKAAIAAGTLIPEGLWITGLTEPVTYTGDELEDPGLQVYYGSRELTPDTDYTVDYSDNTDAGYGHVTVKGKGNYAGSITGTFTILPFELTSDTVTAPDVAYEYNGQIRYGTTTVMCTIPETGRTVTLRAGRDYTYEYPANMTAGSATGNTTYTVKVIGCGNYTGSITFTETILAQDSGRIDVNSLKISSIPAQTLTYDGGGNVVGATPALAVTDRTGGTDTVLTQVSAGSSSDGYSVEYVNNDAVGTATAIITGHGKYYGSRSVDFRIDGLKLSRVTITGFEASLPYNAGSAIEQNAAKLIYKAADGTETELVKERDYTATYTNNIDVCRNRATVTYTGIGAYTGTIRRTFSITAIGLSADMVTADASVPYARGGARPDISIRTGDTAETLIEGVDYTVRYSHNDKPGTASYTITGKGNYTGRIEGEYQVTGGANLTDMTIHADDVVWKDRAGNYRTNVTLTDPDGIRLRAGRDYDSEIIYLDDQGLPLADDAQIAAGTTVNVIIKAASGSYYTGSATTSFRVVGTDISRASVKVADRFYTGDEITLDDADITVIVNRHTLIPGTDYTIDQTSYICNTDIGTAQCTIEGKGAYGGTRTVKFRIAARPVDTSRQDEPAPGPSPAPATYIITYRCNGGTNSMLNPAMYTEGDIVVLDAPTRDGYTFGGWYADSRCEGSQLTQIMGGNHTIYAKWMFNGYAPEPSRPTVTASARTSIVNLAQSWIGRNEADGSHKQIIDIYNSYTPHPRGYTAKYTDSWCAIFVSALSISRGLTDIIPPECSCGQMISLLHAYHEWQESDSYVPHVGDLIFYDWQDAGVGDNTGCPDHVGIIESVIDNVISVIEGNYSDAVKRRQVRVDDKFIRGYGVINYAEP